MTSYGVIVKRRGLTLLSGDPGASLVSQVDFDLQTDIEPKTGTWILHKDQEEEGGEALYKVVEVILIAHEGYVIEEYSAILVCEKPLHSPFN